MNDHSANLDAEVIVHGNGVELAQEIFAGSHKLTADEPVSAGGSGSGPGPYELLLASLGSCTPITVTMYARRKGWPMNGVTVWLRHFKVHVTDCEHCESWEAIIDQIARDIRFDGPLSKEQRDRLLEIANKCPGSPDSYLKGMARRLVCHLWCGEPAQLLVDQRQQVMGSLWIALLDCLKNARKLAHVLRVKKQ